jgi:AcrR family transcriptional regulator
MDTDAKQPTRDRILDQAERLFAERGIEAVSLRAINAAAGVSPGILHYHFGNRETLIEAIISRRMTSLMGARQALIEPLVSGAEPCTSKAIAEALVLPLANFATEQPQYAKPYIRLLSRLYSDRSALLEHVSRRFSSYGIQHLPGLLTQLHPALGLEQAELRIGFANHLLLQSATEWFEPPRPWQLHIEGKLDAIEPLLAFIAAGLDQRQFAAEG